MTVFRNPEHIRAIAAYIHSHPERYDQETFGEQWPCRTAFCIAGTSAVVGGAQLTWNMWDDAEAVHPDEEPLGILELADSYGVGFYAMDKMGLTEDERYALFSAMWRPKDGMSVPEALERFADGESLLVLTSDDCELKSYNFHESVVREPRLL